MGLGLVPFFQVTVGARATGIQCNIFDIARYQSTVPKDDLKEGNYIAEKV